MRSMSIVVAGLAIGWLLAAALEGSLPTTAVPYNGDALRSAIADGMSRAGAATVVRAEGDTLELRR